jgi:DNA polymerase-1
MPPTIYLIDGHALAYRTYFALTRGATGGQWVTSKQEPTAGIYGFASVLLRILEQEHFDYLAVAFDTGKTFRHEFYKEYKATRAKMPDDLRPQITRIQQLVDAFSIPRLEIEGFEADDVLGSVAHRAVSQGLGVKIFTGDRDLLQLVSERIIVNLPGKTLAEAQDYYPEDVEATMGVRPDQVVDFKALTGDTSDNIPGVTGIGQKTAVLLIKTYSTLDGIYQHLDELSTGVRQKLETGRESAYISQRLARIVIDLDIPIDLDMARKEYFDPEKVRELFRELEFRSLVKRFDAWQSTIAKSPGVRGMQLSLFDHDTLAVDTREQQITFPARTAVAGPGSTKTVIVDTPQTLETLAARLTTARQIAFDTETTSTDQTQAGLVGISLSVEPGEGYYIPVGHNPPAKNLPVEKVIAALHAPLTDSTIPKVGHNLKFDYVMLARSGLKVIPMAFDTMVAEWLINPDSHNLGLKKLAWVRLNLQMREIESLIGSGKNQRTMAEAPLTDVAEYAAADADVTLRLMPVLQAGLETSQMVKLFSEVEMPLVPVLAAMEMEGIALDVPFLKKMSVDLQSRIYEIERQVYETVGEEFNLNSTQQLSKALFERLNLQPPDRTRRTTSGHYSTSADVLEIMRGQHQVINWVLEHRELSKLKSTYIDALPMQVNPHTGRVHTSYNQTGSVTGRLASSNPNLQNIPIRTEIGRQVRRAFIASPGHHLLSVDYSQVELRIAAHMAQDKAMMAAFQAEQDIHAATAAAVYGIPLEKVTKEQRRHAKTINFGLIYGMSAFGLTRSSDLTLAEAEDFVKAYFKQFPGISEYIDHVRQQATQRGYVETLLGRRRYFPTLKKFSAGHSALSREEREAINAPIQGTAADIIKIAMLRVLPALTSAGLSVQMLLQVHDELVFECPEAEVKSAATLVSQVMEEAYILSVPLKTEARYGLNWGEMNVV